MWSIGAYAKRAYALRMFAGIYTVILLELTSLTKASHLCLLLGCSYVHQPEAMDDSNSAVLPTLKRLSIGKDHFSYSPIGAR